MPGKGDDSGLLPRVQLVQRGGRVNPGAGAMVPGPLSPSWGLRPDLERGKRRRPSIESLLRQKIIELALNQRTELTGIALAQTSGMNNSLSPPRPIRKGGDKVLGYLEKVWPEVFSPDPAHQAARNEFLFQMKPGPPYAPEPDWCGVFVLWAMKTAIETVGSGPTLGTWGARNHNGGVNDVPGFRTLTTWGPKAEQPKSGDVAVKRDPPPPAKPLGHQFLIHSFEYGPDGKIKSVFSIDGNSDQGGVTTSAPGPPFQPGFDGKTRGRLDPSEILLYCTIF